MMMFSLLLLSVPLIYESAADIYDWKRGKPDKKTLDVFIRSAIMSLVSVINCQFVDQSVTFWQSLFLSFGLFVMFFDSIMGIAIKKDPFYKGETSKTDKFLKKIPLGLELFVRGMVFAAALYNYLTF